MICLFSAGLNIYCLGMNPRLIVFFKVALCLFTLPVLAQNKEGVEIIREEGQLRITIDGAPFSAYHFKNTPRPYLYPLLGPKQLHMTRHWPMKDMPNEEHDHPHHRSLWFAFGSINGVDFWSEGSKAGKTIHEDFITVQSGKKVGVIKSSNQWVTLEGKKICSDVRTIRIYRTGTEERMLDFEITLRASEGDLTFGDTKEGMMSLRLAETMRVKGKVAQGHIRNSEGVVDGATWGKRAKWCDYYGPVDGHIVGAAMFDHPTNPRYPTWWHVRDYGLFAANPFGLHDFEGKPAGSGDLKVSAGESITFSYRIILHEGDTAEAKVAEKFEAFIKEKKSDPVGGR